MFTVYLDGGPGLSSLQVGERKVSPEITRKIKYVGSDETTFLIHLQTKFHVFTCSLET